MGEYFVLLTCVMFLGVAGIIILNDWAKGEDESN